MGGDETPGLTDFQNSAWINDDAFVGEAFNNTARDDSVGTAQKSSIWEDNVFSTATQDLAKKKSATDAQKQKKEQEKAIRDEKRRQAKLSNSAQKNKTQPLAVTPNPGYDATLAAQPSAAVYGNVGVSPGASMHVSTGAYGPMNSAAGVSSLYSGMSWNPYMYGMTQGSIYDPTLISKQPAAAAATALQYQQAYQYQQQYQQQWYQQHAYQYQQQYLQAQQLQAQPAATQPIQQQPPL
jgi:hypothetical protein